MTKREKVLKKIGDLMTKWGVSAKELTDFSKELDTEIADEDFVDDIEEEVGEEVLENIEPNETEETVETETLEKPEEEGKPVVEEVETVEEEPKPAVETPLVTPEQVEELRTAVDGLSAKVDSLTEALTKAGVLTVDTTPVGIDETTTPANEPETSFDDVLSELNRGRKY